MLAYLVIQCPLPIDNSMLACPVLPYPLANDSSILACPVLQCRLVNDSTMLSCPVLQCPLANDSTMLACPVLQWRHYISMSCSTMSTSQRQHYISMSCSTISSSQWQHLLACPVLQYHLANDSTMLACPVLQYNVHIPITTVKITNPNTRLLYIKHAIKGELNHIYVPPSHNLPDIECMWYKWQHLYQDRCTIMNQNNERANKPFNAKVSTKHSLSKIWDTKIVLVKPAVNPHQIHCNQCRGSNSCVCWGRVWGL